MAEPTLQDLKPGHASYQSSRGAWDVLVGEDPVRPLINAIFSDEANELPTLLSQPEWTLKALETNHGIFSTKKQRQDPDELVEVDAAPTLNLFRLINIACIHARAEAITTLYSFAKHQELDIPRLITSRYAVNGVLESRNAAAVEALLLADPEAKETKVSHSRMPLDWAQRKGAKEIVDVLLRHDAQTYEEWYRANFK